MINEKKRKEKKEVLRMIGEEMIEVKEEKYRKKKNYVRI